MRESGPWLREQALQALLQHGIPFLPTIRPGSKRFQRKGGCIWRVGGVGGGARDGLVQVSDLESPPFLGWMAWRKGVYREIPRHGYMAIPSQIVWKASCHMLIWTGMGVRHHGSTRLPWRNGLGCGEEGGGFRIFGIRRGWIMDLLFLLLLLLGPLILDDSFKWIT